MSSPMGGGARQGILSLVVKDKPSLYNAYMPYVRQGGIFVPTTRRYFIGDEVFLLLTFTGQATLWMAVFADMGASLLVVANGLRLLRK